MGKLTEQFIKNTEKAFWQTPLFGMEAMISKDRTEFEELEEEKFEVIKGNVKTDITCKFNPEGYLVSVQYDSRLDIKTKQERLEKLEECLQKAIDEKDFRAAMIFNKQITNIKNQQN